MLSTGYNGVPSGFPHCTDVPCPGAGDPKGDTRRCFSIHAEINAIIQCADLERASAIYVSAKPCFNCAKVIANTPIKRIIALEDYPDPMSDTVFSTAGIHFTIVSFKQA